MTDSKNSIDIIQRFLKISKIYASQEQLNTHKELIRDKRTLNLPEDNILYICEFLPYMFSLKLMRTCKLFMSYHSNIWKLIQVDEFPQSIITNTDELNSAIRDHYYYQNLTDKHWRFDVSNYKIDKFKLLCKQEINLKKLKASLLYMNKNTINYPHNLITQHREISELAGEIKTSVKSLKEKLIKHIKLYKQPNGYYTIKNIDVRLYGINDNDVDAEDVKKWITGEYNDKLILIDMDEHTAELRSVDYHYDLQMHLDGYDSEGEYHSGDDYAPYKQRIIPECLININF
jgi:hypothetical protein